MPQRIRLSKSKVMAGRQCERRVWLEIHRPDLKLEAPAQEARMDQGTAFGELARALLGPGELVDTGADLTGALLQTQALLGARKPPRHLFEATLMHADVLVKVDALRRVGRRHELIEVKSSTRAKEEHYDDCAIQAWVARESGIDLKAVRIGHVNRDFVYAREGDYEGLLALVDASAEVDARITEVPRWIRRFRAVLKGEEPAIATGPHCSTPYDCPFSAHCSASEDPGPDFPLSLLAGAGTGLLQTLEEKGYLDLRELSLEDVSRPAHRNMVRAAKSGKAVVSPELRKTLAALPYPRRYLDFETIQFTVPRWLGTRPYEQIPFQWSCHVEKSQGEFEPQHFLDLSGEDPRRSLARKLIKACGRKGPILVYSQAMEAGVIRALAAQHPDLADDLLALLPRFVDLLPLMREHYYHPAMEGSWSLKSVLPTIAPKLGYDRLDGVADGLAAQDAYLEAIDPATTAKRKREIDTALREYCGLDTLGLATIVQRLGR